MSNYIINEAEFRALNGKVIMVTGGATGIGRAIVDLALRTHS